MDLAWVAGDQIESEFPATAYVSWKNELVYIRQEYRLVLIFKDATIYIGSRGMSNYSKPEKKALISVWKSFASATNSDALMFMRFVSSLA